MGDEAPKARLDPDPPTRPQPGTSPDQAPFTPEELRGIQDEVAKSFPRHRDGANLVLMDVDPRRLHAYWSVPHATLAAAREALGPDGEQAPLVLRFHEPASGSGGKTRPKFDVRVQGLENRWYVDVTDDARRYLAVLGVLGSDGRFEGVARSDVVTLPPLLPEPPPAADSDQPALDVDAALGVRFPEAEAAGPESTAPVAEGEAAEGPLPLENVLTLSSYAMGRQDVQLEVNAELLVEGRTRPGRELYLFGQRVPLRPDGTFSIRRPLPQGALILTTVLTDKPEGEGGEGS